jgi:hypothetical protein
MNLFKLNKDLAVRLNQSFDTLYEMEYMEYSLLINILNEETEEANNPNDPLLNANNIPPMKVDLPDHLKIK